MSPEGPPEPVRVAAQFARLLESLDIPYLLVGSLASSVHGQPRVTDDIDVLADLPEPKVEPPVAALRAEHYVSDEAVREAVRDLLTRALQEAREAE